MEGTLPDRRIIHCLRCSKPFEKLSEHLKRVCMKDNTPEERNQELKVAKDSQKRFDSCGRIFDYRKLRSLVPNDETCDAVANWMQSTGHLMIRGPTPPQLPERRSDSQGSTSRGRFQDLLQMGKPWADDMCTRLKSGMCVTDKLQTLFRYFCTAVFLLGHGQTDTDVTAFKVTEWNDRKEVGDGVQMDVGGQPQACTISVEEEEWLDCYFKHIRPCSLKMQTSESDDRGRFFLGKTGTPITKTWTDVERLDKYFKENREHVTGMSAASSSATFGTMGDMPQSSLPRQEGGAKRPVPGDWESFLMDFPVSLTATAPYQDEMDSAGYGQERRFNTKWRRLQVEQRIEHIVGRCGRRQPTEAKVKALMDSEKWVSNLPHVSEVIDAWVNPLTPAHTEDELLMKSIMEQKWKGLSIKDFGGKKGKGVIATMPFSKGDVVCDYHGTLIPEAEGKRMLEQQTGMGYLFFFKGKAGTRLCIDAGTFPCECHPDKDTFGRRMNHSGKNFNVKPVASKMNFPDGPRHSVLFIATKDIKCDEELKWDYGVRRHSFQGEGFDLDWLDE